jgi:hypothetical protein
MQLTGKSRLAVWRFVQAGSAKTMSAVYTSLPYVRVPISTFDQVVASLSSATTDTQPSDYWRSEGRDSTSIFLLPDWANVRTDDELRYGRYTDNNGDLVQYRYSVDGVRTYEGFGYQDTIAVFTRNLQ